MNLSELLNVITTKRQNLHTVGNRYFVSKRYLLKHNDLKKEIKDLVFKYNLLEKMKEINLLSKIPCCSRSYNIGTLTVDDVEYENCTRTEYPIGMEGSKMKFRLVDKDSDENELQTSIVFREVQIYQPCGYYDGTLNTFIKSI